MKSKIMLVTGASRGIGAEIALEAARNGYFVIVNYNNSKENAEIEINRFFSQKQKRI